MTGNVIIWIIAAIAAAAFVKWGIPYIKSKVDIEKLNKLLAEVKDLVMLAEKLFGKVNDFEAKVAVASSKTLDELTVSSKPATTNTSKKTTKPTTKVVKKSTSNKSKK